MSAPTASGAAFLCDIRPHVHVDNGSFEVISRQRIIGWSRSTAGDTLPVVASGRVQLRAFLPSPKAPEAGMSFVETRCPQTGERQWWSAIKPDKSYTDADMRGVMRKLMSAKATLADGKTSPRWSERDLAAMIVTR